MRGPEVPGEVRAGGKLVLMGEFAVLDGAPALVMAIDRGVRCRRRPAGVLSDSAAVPFELRDGGRLLRASHPELRLAAEALRAVGAPAGVYEFEAWNPVPLAEKPGFGSSSATVVAAVLAGGGEGSEAFDVHARVQGGGSGIDVAASLHGGFLRLEAGHIESAPPPPLAPLVIFSGRGEPTAPRVAAWRAWRGPKASLVRSMGELLGLFYLDPVEATREARLRLLEATHKAGFAYESPALEIIAQEALVLGGAARPSGAGGGDCALAYFHDGDTANRFSRRMAELGFPRIDVRLAGAASFEPSPETWASP